MVWSHLTSNQHPTFRPKTFPSPEEMSCFKCRMSKKCTHVQNINLLYNRKRPWRDIDLSMYCVLLLTAIYLYLSLFIVMCNCVYLLTIPVNTSSGRYFYPSTNTVLRATHKKSGNFLLCQKFGKTGCKVINIREA